MTRHIAFLGNFGPEFSTENEYRKAYEANGVYVTTYQESEPDEIDRLTADLWDNDEYDFIHWTSTPSFRQQAQPQIKKMLREAHRREIPVVAVHLDQFRGIPEREEWVRNDSYFLESDVFFGSQGNDVDWFRSQGVPFEWLLPGVSSDWCHPGTPRERYRSDIVFVGSWQGHYHKNSTHRHRLVRWLQNTYGDRVSFWPEQNRPAIRGNDLTDLYWSAKVVVGDSFAPGGPGTPPPPLTCSDRIPETLGRGGILAAPRIEGINDDGAPFNVDAHQTWEAWDWNDAKQTIDMLLDIDDVERDRRRRQAITYIRQNHSYEARVRQIFVTLNDRWIL